MASETVRQVLVKAFHALYPDLTAEQKLVIVLEELYECELRNLVEVLHDSR